ncbi:MAG: sensor domain-containing diguanylate cyclase [Pseudomonadota bacterium]
MAERDLQQSTYRPTSASDRSVKKLFEDAAANEQILRRYQEFELRMLSAESFEELLAILLISSREFFRLRAVELWLYDSQGLLAELVPAKFADRSGVQLLVSERTLARLYLDEPKVRLLSIDDVDPLPVLKDRDVRSAALLPLYRKGSFVGSLHFGAVEAQRFSSSKSTDFISHMASIIAVCIENALSQEHLRRLSVLDTLTKVKNRRGFHDALDKEISRAQRNGESLSLLFVDLDHFKAVNDNYGHLTGDRVLKTVAEFFKGVLRRVDHVCRYGGEEFALILPSCDDQLAIEIAERLRQEACAIEVAVHNEDRDTHDTVSVSLSIGVCSWRAERRIDPSAAAEIATLLIARSDQGVYKSKEDGRNRVSYMPFSAS